MRTLFYLSYWCRIAISMMVMQAKWRSSHLLGKGRPSSLVMLSIWVLVQPWWSKLQPTLQTIPLPKELNLWQLSRKSCSHSVYNQQQNELRHFALNGAFYVLLTSKGGNITFPPPSPPCNVVLLFELLIENNKHPNFEWRGQRRSVDTFVLWSYPIWRQYLNCFVGSCRYEGVSSHCFLSRN